MRKCILFVLASGLASVFGLAGCGSKKSDGGPGASPRVVRDSFEPTLRVDQGRGFVDVSQVKDVDLSDRFEFGGATTTKTHVQCGNLGAERAFETAATLAQMVPDELLTHDLRHKPEDCTLHFELRNKNGSTWVLSHHAVVMHDEQPPAIAIGRDDGTEIPLSTAATPEMDTVRLRSSHTGEAKFVCRDAEFGGPGSFDRVMNFSYFDFRRPRLRPDRVANILNLRRHQPCRAVIQRDGRTVAFSGLQTLLIYRMPLVLTHRPSPPAPLDVDALNARRPLVMSHYELWNPDNFTRRVLIRGDRYPTKLEIYWINHHLEPTGNWCQESVGPHAWLETPGVPVAPVREILIPPNGRIEFRLIFQPTTPIYYPRGEGVSVQLTELLSIYEVEEDHQTPIQKIDLNPPQPTWFLWSGILKGEKPFDTRSFRRM